MPQLTFEQLQEATAGGSVALRSLSRLQPAGGQGDKVFPPSYAVEGRAEHKYVVEQRQVDDKVVDTVLLDSVASQANRAELALLEGWESGDLAFPVPYVDFTDEEDVADIGRLTALEAPHRFADAIFRDSLLDDTLFRLSDLGRAITDATPRDATALFRSCPTALLFGMWDSTGPKGGLGSKFQRAYVSEIVGLNAQVGRKVGSRLDPLQIERLEEANRAYNHADPAQIWTFDVAEAEKDPKGNPVPASRGSESGTAGQPSKINHGNVAPTIDSLAGGVTISEALQTTVISLAALRRLRFAGHDRATQTVARTAIAALGVAAIVFQHEMDYDLRSRCLLVPQHPPRIELVGRDGSAPEEVDVDRATAVSILRQSVGHAAEVGLGWMTEEIRLEPAPKLIELIRRSREVAYAEQPGV
jgi:CRISPR-associated protein Csb1